MVFLDLLPPAAKDAALQHSSLSAMAAAADKIVQEGSPAAGLAANVASVSEVATAAAALALDDISAVARTDRRPSSSLGCEQDSRPPRALRFLSSNHARWGRNAYRCSDPSTCHMRDLIRPRHPPVAPSQTVQGNGRAGRQ